MKTNFLFSPIKSAFAIGILFLAAWMFPNANSAQTQVLIHPDSSTGPLGSKFDLGVFYVPKTQAAQTDFLNNGLEMNTIRLHIIESALNNASNLNECLALLDTVAPILQSLAAKTPNLLFIFEKTPAWLSSSSDGSPAGTPGWYVLNTKPPADYNQWNAMVTAVVNKLVVQLGIQNASFEIWNEPDLGSWTGTEAEFFELFRNTYASIRAVAPNAPIGGPALNHWANHINYQSPAGYVSPAAAEQSLIAELIDSSLVWQMPLDFLSWHSFEVNPRVHSNAESFITTKYAALGQSPPALIVSEWNAPSQIRDTPLHRSYLAKQMIDFTTTGISGQAVAAWQDFEPSPNEFHGEYGLLTTGAIHKPAYKALLLAEKMRGDAVKWSSSGPLDLLAAVEGDTLRILLSNFAPPPFLEAFYHTLFEGEVTYLDLDSLGFIDVANSSLNPLDSIYQGLLPLPSGSPLDAAVAEGRAVYAHFDSLNQQRRMLQLEIAGFAGIAGIAGIQMVVDSTRNNFQHVYDSLVAQGNTQANAVAAIVADQSMDADSVVWDSAGLQVEMQANAVHYYEFVLPGLLALGEEQDPEGFQLFPNPTSGRIWIRPTPHGREVVSLWDANGRQLAVPRGGGEVDLSGLPAGIYFLQVGNGGLVRKVVRR